MRTMMTAKFPVEASNRAIKDGALPKILEALMKELKPEAAYFTAVNGLRTAIMVFDMKDPSQMPSIAEPLFMGMNAAVDFQPVMNAEDLKAGLEKAARKF